MSWALGIGASLAFVLGFVVGSYHAGRHLVRDLEAQFGDKS